MSECIDLEIAVYPSTGDLYRVEARITNPYAQNVRDPAIANATFRKDALEGFRRERNWLQYGRTLSDDLFGAQGGVIAGAFRDAIGDAHANKTLVRLRLVIDQGASELHALLWETLLDPTRTEDEGPQWLAASADVLLSRFLTGGRAREFSLRQKFQVRALVFVANPAPPRGVNLAPIDVDAEIRRARATLGGIATTIVASTAQAPGQATLKRLLQNLDNTYDLLYLVCHGFFELGELPDTWLHFEDETGALDRVRGRQLVAEFQRLAVPPNLVLLASCQTAGDAPGAEPGRPAVSSQDRALAALGPRLIRAGVPAVVAMQGNVLMDTAEAFMTTLLTDLQQSGTIDHAAAEGRRAIVRQPDFYAPVLFHRLKTGRLWYGEEVVQEDDGIDWQTISEHVKNGQATAILGSGLLEPYIGSQAELALRLAGKLGYHFAEKNREDLAMVTQYLVHARARKLVETEILRHCAAEVIRQHGESVAQILGGGTFDARVAAIKSLNSPALERDLMSMLQAVWQQRRASDPNEPHAVLARLPFKAYISTNPDRFVETALRARPDTKPIVWESGRSIVPRASLQEGQPSSSEPLVAYLYGTFDKPGELIVTEDDYFEHLKMVAQGTTAYVTELNSIFVDSALIFLGFRLHEWDFRVLFRRLKQIEGWSRHTSFSHVAVQIDPSSAGGSATSADVRRFLNGFLASTRIHIFEGSVGQFVTALNQRVG